MPQLSWKLSDTQLEMKSETAVRMEVTTLRLHLDQPQANELAEAISALGPSNELRHTLTAQWTLFWKLREGESRLLLAHPESEHWVATLALTSADRDVIAGKLSMTGEAKLSEVLALGWQSNLDLVLAIR